VGWIAAVALVVIIVVAAVALRPRNGDDTAKVTHRLLAPLAGIPQDGITLGRLDAPDRLAVYADVLSAGFGTFQEDVLPELVRRYVRPGQMAIQIRTLPEATDQALSGISDPALAARGAQAAGLQNHLWQYLAVLSARYPGYFDSDVLADVLSHTPGVQVRAAERDVKSRRIARAVERAATRARGIGLRRPPGFVFDLAGGRPARALLPGRLTAAAFIAALEAAKR
jgi:hypothetical protein